MNPIRTTGSASLIALCAALPAAADVTASGLWADWKSYMTDFGYEVTATESQNGNTLELSNVTMFVDMASEGDAQLIFPRITFTENGDGTVRLAMPDPGTMTVDFNPTLDDTEAFEMTMAFDYSQADIIVSGSDNDHTYTIGAELLKIAITDFEADGEDAVDLDMALDLHNVASTYDMKIGNRRDTAQEFSAERADFSMNIKEMEGPENDFSVEGTYENLTFSGEGVIPIGSFVNEDDQPDIAGMVRAGFAFAGNFGYGAASANVVVTEEGDEIMRMATSATDAYVDISMSEAGLAYSGAAKNTVIEGQAADFPLPISAGIAETTFEFAMPLLASEEAQDFKFAFGLNEFTMADMLWGVFDPAGKLPRDPATLSVDIAGTAQMLIDFLDPKTAEAMESGEMGSPGEFRSVEIRDLLVSAVGASIAGKGGFTFDNSDLETFDGMPRPEGAVDLEIKGANGLIDRLIELGFVQPDEAMGARMMLGMLAKPVGDDHLTSKIEINAEGHVMANGQRLQ